MTAVIRGRGVNRLTGRSDNWELSLHPLSEGGSDFRGRPALTDRIRSGFESRFRSHAHSSAYRARSNLHYFWRFLDDYELLSRNLPGLDAVDINDLDWAELEVIWPRFIDWLGHKSPDRFSPRTKYYINSDVCSVFLWAFEMAVEARKTEKTHLEVYVYFSDVRQNAYGGECLSFDEAKEIFGAFSKTWRGISRRIRQGHALAAQGTNPMVGSSGSNRWNGGAWASLENRLWAIREFLPFSGLHREPKLIVRLRGGFSSKTLPEGFAVPELDQSRIGLSGHVPAVFLSRAELAIAFAMVTMKSGMNPDAISRMRVENWFTPDPLQPESRVIIFGPKRVVGKWLRASSSRSKLTDPYQIICRVIEIQAPLRARLKELAIERGDPALAEQADLIWIGVGDKGVFDFRPTLGGTYYTTHQKLDEYFDRVGLLRADGSPQRYRVTQGRDVWGLFVYHRSGFNQLLTAQALGHSTLASLLHYLEKRVLVVADLKRLADLQNRVLIDISEGRFAPASLRSREMATAVTGLHCTDPQNPPPEADPGNRGGTPCAAQRCWTCWKWYASRESLPWLLRMITDLETLRSTLSFVLWQTSDYPLMLAVYEHIVAMFHDSHVEAAREIASTMTPIVTTSLFVSRDARLSAA